MLTLARIQPEEPSIFMSELFVIRNQLGHYWGKSKAWVDGSDPRTVMRARHRDDAVNTLFELSSKDFELRGEVLPVESSERGEPMIEPSQNPIPLSPQEEAEPVEDTSTL
jgi:hypothetical protein